MGSGFLRNAPCGCGSGRKYKKCCGLELPPPKSLNDRVVEFAMSGLHDRELQEAWEEWGEAGSFKKADERDFGNFIDWLAAGRRRGGKTQLERFIEANGAGLSEAERAELADHQATRMAVLEVLEVRPGTGLRVKDLFSGEEFDAADKSASRATAAGDVLAVRTRRGSGPAKFWGVGLPFSPLEKAELLFDIEAAYGQAKVHQPELSRQAFLDSSVGTLKRLLRGYRARRTVSTTVTEHGPLPKGMGPEAIMATMALERGRLWPEKPVPALGGCTPAKAALDEDGRALLGVLLKEYEANQARGGRQPGVQGLMNIPAIVWMRNALGLEVGPELAEALEALDSAAGLQ